MIIALLSLGYKVIRQIILPSRRRKGNLLSSLFILFTGLTEHAIGFAEGIIRIPGNLRMPAALDKAWMFSRKYLRHGMLMATWALFILASFEWTGPGRIEEKRVDAGQQVSIVAGETKTVCNKVIIPAHADDEVTPLPRPEKKTGLKWGSPLPVPRWLLLCVCRL